LTRLRRVTSRARRGMSIVETLMTIAILGVLLGLLAPALQYARESSRRRTCANHLRQLAQGLQAYDSQNRGLPNGKRHSWIVYLLPLVDEKAVSERFKFIYSWDDPANQKGASSRLSIAECPSAPHGLSDVAPNGSTNLDLATTDYAAITQVDTRLVAIGQADVAGPGVMPIKSGASLSDVTDGRAHTILVAESAGRPQIWRRGKRFGELPNLRVNGAAWCRPEIDISLLGSSYDGAMLPGACALNCTNGEGVTTSPDPYYGTQGTGQLYSFHPAGINAAMADGSVRFLAGGIDMRVVARLATRAGGEENPRLED
jgi:prepilin-type N-terminal cleavage/methylation domain-containing protein/prepilin-type processing-associated H-X9-DG protein